MFDMDQMQAIRMPGIPMDGDGVVFMHVGPNGITIDSMSAQADNDAGEGIFLYFFYYF